MKDIDVDIDVDVDVDVRIDHQRTARTGMPEAIYCAGKSVEQCVDIVSGLLELAVTDAATHQPDTIIATRATPDQQAALAKLSPSATSGSTLTWRHRRPSGSQIAIVCAGTSDLPVAEEARLTLEALGHETLRRTDVGVAGLHRLLNVVPDLQSARVIIAIAGMEGALPTVVAGLIRQPIISVPTSVGYGSAFAGATALLSMMASCAPGIAVVGIDNGFGAACAAHRIVSDHR